MGSRICWVSIVPQPGAGGGLTSEPGLVGAGPLSFGGSTVKTGKNAERHMRPHSRSLGSILRMLILRKEYVLD